MFNRYYKFHKYEILFQLFFEYIFIFLYIVMYIFFCHKYILESHNISWKNEFFFLLNSLCYGLPYYAKSLEKYAPNLPWLKF